jgi:membrane-associated protease RseP (regulator of RpoE activity)
MESSTPAVIGLQDRLMPYVNRVMAIEDVTTGGPKDAFAVRFRGRLRSEDTPAAFNELYAALRPMEFTPLFRMDGTRHAILIIEGTYSQKRANPIINLGLFILTLISVLLSGALFGLSDPLPAGFFPAALALIERGWPFAISLIAILGAHELGHYFAGRAHGVNVTLPYFIPFPFSPFGTMGAFINMKEPPKNRRHLLDIGIAGPLAGLIVAIPVTLIGLSLSKLDAITLQPGYSFTIEGNSILYLLLKYLTFGQLLPHPASYGNLPVVLYWLRYFFTGQPVPLGGLDVMIHPVAWAGWAGILVTAMNLIPAGQLDGGHMIYVLLGRKWAARLFPVILVILFGLGFFWNGWWLWVALVFFLGRSYAEPLDQITELDGKRKALAVLALILFVLTFAPVPLIVVQ